MNRRPVHPQQQSGSMVATALWASILLAAFLWLTDTLLEYLWFNEGGRDFLSIFMPLDDANELIMRSLSVSVLVVGGIVVGQILELLAVQQRMTEGIAEDLRTTLNSIGDAVITTDTRGNVTRMNPIAEKLTGWTLEEAWGKPLTEVFHIVNAKTEALAFDPVKRVLESGEIVGLTNDTLLISNNGIEYQIADSAAPIRGGDGEITGVVLVFRDVTREYGMQEELREAFRALKENESKLREAHKMAHLGNWFWDVKAGDVEWSEEVYKIFWLDPQEFTPRIDSILALSPWPEDHQRNKELIRKAVEDHEQGTFEQRFLRPDGSTGYYFSTFQGIYDNDGNLISMKGTVQDITGRKQQETELCRLRNYLSNIIDSMPSVLIGVDADRKVTQWNCEAQNVTGVMPEDALGQPLAKVFPRLTKELDRVREAMQTQQVHSDPKVAHQQNGEVHFEDVTIYPLITNGVEGVVIRVDDVTERVRLEEMMVQSEKMLSVGGLAAGMAHEINNPLAGMMQTADVMHNRLTGGRLPANLRAAEAAGTSMDAIHAYMEARGIPRMTAAIRESGHRVVEIVDNMLGFARKSDSVVSSHKLSELLDKSVELAATDYDLKKQYDFKTIRIVRKYAENLPPVPCEGAKIQQVLLNILCNGAQAMQGAQVEKPTFILRACHESERGMVRIEIEDNGPGMDENTRRRVFEPFFTTKPVGIGTGLGLSVSYFIVTENHGGEISVDSEPGRGARFVVHLPLEKTGGKP